MTGDEAYAAMKVRLEDALERIRILTAITDAQRATAESLMNRIDRLERRCNALDDRSRGLAAFGGGG